MRFKASAGSDSESLGERAPSLPVMTCPWPLLPPFSRGLGSATATPPRGVAQVSRSPAIPPSSAPGSGPRGGPGLVRVYVCVWWGGTSVLPSGGLTGTEPHSAFGSHPGARVAPPCTPRILDAKTSPSPFTNGETEAPRGDQAYPRSRSTEQTRTQAPALGLRLLGGATSANFRWAWSGRGWGCTLET